MKKKSKIRRTSKKHSGAHKGGYFIIVGNKKPIPVTGLRTALNKAWEISEKTDAVIRVVKLTAKFKSGARIALRTGKTIKPRRA